MTSIDKLCEILKAHEEGKTVELYCETGLRAPCWEAVNPTGFYVSSLLKSDLRIKPEPREVWALVYRDGSINALPTKEEAEEWASDTVNGYFPEIVRYREVMGDE